MPVQCRKDFVAVVSMQNGLHLGELKSTNVMSICRHAKIESCPRNARGMHEQQRRGRAKEEDDERKEKSIACVGKQQSQLEDDAHQLCDVMPE
ncbi:hypothetical protein Nepgr_001139 [Nepenthes gracilis]|uniref:Uncharacterized protein n=1 Tax=Nepenthes gracilis TaxID=150966 RepID=A0AAD3RXI7_NEPGR|nr:hypothetical protein Nepgr_001139 [Nepenthes gracilis]